MTIRFTPKFMLGTLAAAALTLTVCSGCTNNKTNDAVASTTEKVADYNKQDSIEAAGCNAKVKQQLNETVKQDSIAMVEAIKAMKGINFNKLNYDYDLAAKKRENARKEVEIAKKDNAQKIVEEKETNLQKVYEATQPAVDRYENALKTRGIANGEKYKKSKKLQESFNNLFNNKPLINTLSKYGYSFSPKGYCVSISDPDPFIPFFDDKCLVLLPVAHAQNREELLNIYDSETVNEVLKVFDLKTGKKIHATIDDIPYVCSLMSK